MMRFRLGVLVSLTAAVVLLSGCEGFKMVRRGEYERLRSMERLNKEQAIRISALLGDKERLTDKNKMLEAAVADKIDIIKAMENEREQVAIDVHEGVGTLEGVPGDVEVTQEVDGIGIVATSDVLFDVGSSDLKSQGKSILDQIVPILKEKPNKIRIAGYTDSQWTGVSTKFRSNFHLSAMRALSVLNYLKEKGVDPARMHFAGYGEHELVMDGGQENKKKSRRVKIILLYDWATHTSGETVPDVTPK